ncbi:MAG: M48 family metalloprotease [Sandarakinorhabdus sp.]|nr:M48 family metalloprotease [Sandarakinorhabdus sp.]
MRVVVALYGDRIVVRGDEDVVGVLIKRLRRDASLAERPTLYRTDQSEWSLAIEDATPDSWVADIPTRSRFPVRLASLAVGIAALACAGLWAGRDEIILATAPLLPHGVTDPIGRAYLAEMGKPCDIGAGNAALVRLTARLLPTALPEPITVTVVDNPEVNAVALPGGHVALFRGLIDQAKSADEIAAALAHEIEHIAFQHPNQNILRDSGPAVIARTLGSNAGKMADLTVLKKGNKAAEAEADTGAIALLAAADVSTRGAAEFFARAAAQGDDGFNTSHPSDKSRAKRFAAATRSGTEPALKDGDWLALKGICQPV